MSGDKWVEDKLRETNIYFGKMAIILLIVMLAVGLLAGCTTATPVTTELYQVPAEPFETNRATKATFDDKVIVLR